MEKYFFDIPIYRLSKDDFYSKLQKNREKSVFSIIHDEGDDAIPVSAFDMHIAYSWDFNEIVGWLRLYFYGSMLQIDYVVYDYKRKDFALAIKKKKYKDVGRFTEMMIDFEKKSSEITEDIIEYIKSAHQCNRLIDKFFIEFDSFKQVGNLIDWKGIMYSSNHEDYKNDFLEYQNKQMQLEIFLKLLERIQTLNSEIIHRKSTEEKYPNSSFFLYNERDGCCQQIKIYLEKFGVEIKY